MKKNYDQVTPIKITVEGGLSPDRSLQLTLHPYATIEEWVDTFKVMLMHQTFSENAIKELFDPQIDHTMYTDTPDYLEHKDPVNYKQESYNWKKEF